MASLPGDRLTEAQRADQARRAARLAADIARNFRGVQIGDISSQRNFIEASIPLVLKANRDSARSARTYAITMSSLEGGLADEVTLADPPKIEAIRTSLRVMGPIGLQQKVTRIQVPLDEPAGKRLLVASRQEATAAVAGAAVRHAMDGGRDTIREYADDPPKGKRIRGWVRITRDDDKVCYFCAMLASRANYLEDSFDISDQLFSGEGTAKVHDSCRCILRPMYGSVLPDSVLRYRRAWSAMSGGDKDPVNNFRSNWTHRDADWDKAVA